MDPFSSRTRNSISLRLQEVNSLVRERDNQTLNESSIMLPRGFPQISIKFREAILGKLPPRK